MENYRDADEIVLRKHIASNLFANIGVDKSITENKTVGLYVSVV